MRGSFFILAPIALATSLMASPAVRAAQDNLITNGSLNGAIGNNSIPTGWQIMMNSPDVMDGANNAGVSGLQFFGATPDASPDGGTWVGLGINGSYVERFGQVLNGLTIGQTYTVSWFAGNFGLNRPGTGGATPVEYLGSNAINVMLDGVSIGSGSTLGLSSNWLSESLTFTATSASQQLSFKLASGTQAYLSIDGIAVVAGGTPPAIPEPGTWALMGLGLVGLALVKRRTQA